MPGSFNAFIFGQTKIRPYLQLKNGFFDWEKYLKHVNNLYYSVLFTIDILLILLRHSDQKGYQTPTRLELIRSIVIAHKGGIRLLTYARLY